MGFFRDVGRRVERFKSEVEAVADDQASFQCTACGERFHADHDTCPACGADAVEPRAVEADADADGPDEDDVDTADGADDLDAETTETSPDEPSS